MARMVSDVHVRFSEEELADLRALWARQQSPVSSVIRAMVRDYLIKWRKEQRLELELGVVTWQK